MPRVLPQLARTPARLAFALFVVSLLGTFLCPAVAQAQVAGLCSELAQSDIAPAPMVPTPSGELWPEDCDPFEAKLRGGPLPREEGPAASSWERVPRVLPTLLPWVDCRQRTQAALEAELLPADAGFWGGVFRPPR